ncbi:MAG: exopolysaccharide biosynthesis protein [Desulfohalobiaceae bacterium]|nr:exopolysaccharide biosynthesis protein [Desulfohalobiaceae bacterium]
MSKDQELKNLNHLLDRIGEAAQNGGRVSLGAILEVVGRRSFGPVLLLAGLVTLAPVIGDIPGVPSIIGMLVFLITAQLLFRREHIWLPDVLLNRSLPQDKLQKGLRWLRPTAQFVDRLLSPRLTIFTAGAVTYFIASLCMVISVLMPIMEMIPFSANAAGAAFTVFGLSLIARDGLLALLAFMITAFAAGLVVFSLL